MRKENDQKYGVGKRKSYSVTKEQSKANFLINIGANFLFFAPSAVVFDFELLKMFSCLFVPCDDVDGLCNADWMRRLLLPHLYEACLRRERNENKSRMRFACKWRIQSGPGESITSERPDSYTSCTASRQQTAAGIETDGNFRRVSLVNTMQSFSCCKTLHSTTAHTKQIFYEIPSAPSSRSLVEFFKSYETRIILPFINTWSGFNTFGSFSP